MKIVETKSQLNKFLELYHKHDSIILPIMSDVNLHTLHTSLSLIFVRVILEQEYAFGNWRIIGDDYMICLNHSECEGLDFDISELNNDNVKYTTDVNYTFSKLDNVINLNLFSYLKTNELISFTDGLTPSHIFLERMYWNRKNINTLVPIVKHYEVLEKEANILEDYIIKFERNKIFDIYTQKVIENLLYVESSGLKVDKDLLPLEYKKHLSEDDIIYSQYNPYTSTGRPSNRFGGLNFAALNKDDGSRKAFISRFNGMLIELDYDAYHLRLIADMIGYKFPKGSVHKYFAKQYDVSYEESKGLSFKFLYGGIPKEISENIPFFGEVDKYIKSKWSEYKENLSVLSDIYSKRIYSDNLDDMNPNKLFNYLIQLAETESNMNVISDIKELLQDKKSKLVLYLYDSFLFDFNKEDEKDLIINIKKIIERQGKYPTKIKIGQNYHDMSDVTEKMSEF